MEPIKHVDGKTNFAKRLLADAIREGCSRVEGVAEIRGDFAFNLRWLFSKRKSRGVVVRENANTIAIEICLMAQHGYTVPDVSYRVQESAIAAASTLTDKKVRRVNVKFIRFVHGENKKKPAKKRAQS